MSDKFDFSDSTHKYNISPAQLLSTPPPSSIPSTRTRSRVPNPSPAMPATNPAYHRVPASDYPPSIVDDDAASFPPTTRLIRPAIHAASFYTPTKDTHTFTIYPTLLLRLIVLAFLSASIALFSFAGEEPRAPTENRFHTVPAVVSLSLAALRTSLVIAFPVSRRARWAGLRGLNAAVDVGLVTALLVTTIEASKGRDWSHYWKGGHKEGFIIAWVVTALYALAALDSGSPDRFYIRNFRLSAGVDFRFGEDDVVTDEWDDEARDVAERP